MAKRREEIGAVMRRDVGGDGLEPVSFVYCASSPSSLSKGAVDATVATELT